MPTDDGVRGDERQVLAPTDTPSASQAPEQLVPGAQPSGTSASRGTTQDDELVTQAQILEYEILARAD